MNTWPLEDDAAFKKVTWRLCEMLDADPNLRKACKENRVTAKETLRIAGDFDRIPDEVEVFIMEDDVKANSNVVTVILPEQSKVPDWDHFEAKKYWACTWNLYPQLRMT